MSKRRYLKIIYEAILTAASPGDVIFFITNTPTRPIKSRFSRLYREWQGIIPEDTSKWHTSIYVGPKKETKGAQYRPYIVHSHSVGTTEEFIPPTFFTAKQLEGQEFQQCRIEILHNPSISKENRKQIVNYSLLQVGKPFDGDGWFRDWVTYSLGVRSKIRNPKQVSCHGLAYDAYELVGLLFQHQLQNAPDLIGRIFGRPVGHPKDHVNLRYNYLRDHHLYRDERFIPVLSVFGGPNVKDIKTKQNPGKYSWNHVLQVAYGF